MVWDVVRGMFWPVGNLAVMMFTTPTKEGEFLMKDGKTKASAADAFGSKPIANTLKDHLAVQFGTIQKLLWAAVVWYYFTDLEGAKRGDFAWLSTILVRDILITLYHGGVWDLVVYSPYSPFRKFLKSYKFNPEYPNTGRFFHDLFWSLCSTVISSLFEAWTLRQWVGGVSLGMPLGAHTHDTWWRDGATLAWLVTMPYWRLGHFFFLHRSMHKWFPGRQPGTGVIPDIGEQIYNYVHSLHHKAKNPTALSGVAMHPIESSGYYTAMWIPHAVAAAARALPALFPAALGASIHPIVLLYTKMDLTIAALVGHDGHGYPGGGSQCHWLHHVCILGVVVA